MNILFGETGVNPLEGIQSVYFNITPSARPELDEDTV